MSSTRAMSFRLTQHDLQILDSIVADGAKDRTTALRRALIREHRRILGARDAAIYAAIDSDDPEEQEMLALAEGQNFSHLDD